jgi:NHL repeat
MSMFASPASSAPVMEFGTVGSGAGQFSEPRGVAIDQQSGHLYLTDRQNNRIDEFSGEGVFVRAWGWGVGDGTSEMLQACVTSCFRGLEGGGKGEFDFRFNEPSLGSIAVDNASEDPLDSSVGDVYVLDRANHRVEKFDGEGHFELEFAADGEAVAVGPTGTVYVGEEGSVTEYTTEGSPSPPTPLEEAGSIVALAVGAEGEIFAVGRQGVLREYAPGGGTPLRTVDDEAQALTLGLGGNLFVDHGTINETQLREYDRNGAHLASFASTSHTRGGIAFGATLDSVYVIEKLEEGVERVSVITPPAPGPFVLPGSESASEITPTSAKLGAGISPEGGAETKYHFEYGTTTAYGESSPSSAPLNAVNEVESVTVAATGGVFTLAFKGEASVEIALNATAAEIQAALEAIPALGAGQVAVSGEPGGPWSVEFTGARADENVPELIANPGALTGPEPSAVVATTTPGFSLFDDRAANAAIAGLQASTTYHFRVVAENAAAQVTDGPDQTFTTLPPAFVEGEFSTDVRSTSATLHATINPLGSATSYHFLYGPSSACEGGECSVPVPDQAIGSGKTEVEQHIAGLTAGQTYHYRVVVTNALEKAPGEIQGDEHSFTTQIGGGTGLPDGRQWELVSPPDKHGAELSGIDQFSFIQAAASGDAIVYVSSGPTEARPQGNSTSMQIYATRGSAGWSSTDLEVPHSESTGVQLDLQYEFFTPDLSLGALQPWGTFDPALSAQATEQTPYIRDNRHGTYTPLVTRANDTAEPFEPFGGEVDGECQLVQCGPKLAAATPDLSHAVIGTGTVGNPEGVPLVAGAGPQGLYEWATGHLSLVSELPEGGPASGNLIVAGTESVKLHSISNDGSRVFWENAETRQLYLRDVTRSETIPIGTPPVRLYAFEGANAEGSLVFSSGQECEVTVTTAGKLDCRVIAQDGVTLGFSEDGSWVYFEESGDLYVRHNGATRLIAAEVGTLKSEGEERERKATKDPWRVSPDGEWFAFMSTKPLTGYDSRDAATSAADEEVFLYDAANGTLTCASCDPTGARPHGVPANSRALTADGMGWTTNPGVAASIPAWAGYENQRALYQPRYLSDSGRLFFDSSDALVPRDVNGQEDVYEFEPEGEGGCSSSATSGTVVYVGAAKACVALISSGESPDESAFVDASESGDDVFFLSTQKLTPQDVDGSLSLWDAHVCTGAAPCLPTAAPGAPPCDTETACRASQTPQPQIFGAPASSTFSGPGNPAPIPSSGPKGKTAAQVRAERLAKALRTCRRKHNKRKRHTCEAKERRRYGPAKKATRVAEAGRRAAVRKGRGGSR